MNEIKEGEYIRTYEGTIHKVKSVAKGLEDDVFIKDSLIYTDEIAILRGEIKAHSKNIIDLIEVGDYVNGYRVDEIHDFSNGSSRVICNKYVGERQSFTDVQIRGIVTKEQFNSVMYKVGDIE